MRHRCCESGRAEIYLSTGKSDKPYNQCSFGHPPRVSGSRELTNDLKGGESAAIQQSTARKPSDLNDFC